MSRGTKALISRSALINNFNRVRQLAPDSKVWAVVKANGYGHGAINVATTLKNADGFAVSTLDEGIALRESGVVSPVLLLEGVTEAQHLQRVVDENFHAIIHCWEQLEHLESQAQSSFGTIDIWLMVDSGMHRLGFQPVDLIEVRRRLSQLVCAKVCGVMTHMACADDGDHPEITEIQLQRFQHCIEPDDRLSIANSASIYTRPETHVDWVRPGIMLYGASPFTDRSVTELGLTPVMSLLSPVIALRTVKSGEAIGYGHRWQASRDSVIATLAIGYGDGYPRHAPDGTPIWLNGQIVPLVGRVSMDMLMADVTDLSAVKVGDAAELWGANLPVDEVASYIGTIGYELLTRLSLRVANEMVP